MHPEIDGFEIQSILDQIMDVSLPLNQLCGEKLPCCRASFCGQQENETLMEEIWNDSINAEIGHLALIHLKDSCLCKYPFDIFFYILIVTYSLTVVPYSLMNGDESWSCIAGLKTPLPSFIHFSIFTVFTHCRISSIKLSQLRLLNHPLKTPCGLTMRQLQAWCLICF